MYSIFWKSIFISFMSILLFVNLLFFSNVVVQYNPNFQAPNDIYFGFTTLYDFLKSGFQEDSSFLTGYYKVLVELMRTIKQYTTGNWMDFARSGGIHDLISFFTAFANYFKMLAGFVMLFGYVGLALIYALMLCAWVIIKFTFLLSGLYWSNMPAFTYA